MRAWGLSTSLIFSGVQNFSISPWKPCSPKMTKSQEPLAGLMGEQALPEIVEQGEVKAGVRSVPGSGNISN